MFTYSTCFAENELPTVFRQSKCSTTSPPPLSGHKEPDGQGGDEVSPQLCNTYGQYLPKRYAFLWPVCPSPRFAKY